MWLGMVALLASAQAADLSGEVLVQASPQGAWGTGAGVRLERDTVFVAMEGRSTTTAGLWSGRATGGVDLFGGSDRLEMTLGLFVGTTGARIPEATTPLFQVAGTAGFEVGLGVSAGPLHLRYRHADGFQGALEDRLTEDEVRLGYRMLGTVEVFGQYLRFNPDGATPIDGYGAGVKLLF